MSENNTTTVQFTLSSPDPLPDNIQELIDNVSNLFLKKVVDGGVNSVELSEQTFEAMFDYAEENGYDIRLVSQVIDQILETFGRDDQPLEVTIHGD